MLLWILLTCGLALGVGAAACVAATREAERRARRNLYGSLGLSDDLISLLMGRKGPVSVQLTLVRQAALSSGVGLEDLRRNEGPQAAAQRSFRCTRTPDDARPGGGDQPALAPARRNPPRGRDRA